MPIFLKVNHQLESRVQEICQSGSEGGARPTFVPTPIANPKSRPVEYGMIRAGMRTDSTWRPFPREIPLGLAAPDHTVPYGTVLSRDTFPGTSCLATIVLSLRDADLPEVLALSNVQTPLQALRAWLRSCCPSGTKYILLVEA